MSNLRICPEPDSECCWQRVGWCGNGFSCIASYDWSGPIEGVGCDCPWRNSWKALLCHAARMCGFKWCPRRVQQ